MLLCAVVSQLGHSLHVVTSSLHGSSNQPNNFLKLRRDMAFHMEEVLCATGGGGISCVCYAGAMLAKRAFKTGIAALSVAILCASQKMVMCMIWAVHKTGSW